MVKMVNFTSVVAELASDVVDLLPGCLPARESDNNSVEEKQTQQPSFHGCPVKSLSVGGAIVADEFVVNAKRLERELLLDCPTISVICFNNRLTKSKGMKVKGSWNDILLVNQKIERWTLRFEYENVSEADVSENHEKENVERSGKQDEPTISRLDDPSVTNHHHSQIVFGTDCNDDRSTNELSSCSDLAASNAKKHRCSSCNYSTVMLSRLEDHMRILHGVKNESCNGENQNISNRAVLNVNQSVSTESLMNCSSGYNVVENSEQILKINDQYIFLKKKNEDIEITLVKTPNAAQLRPKSSTKSKGHCESSDKLTAVEREDDNQIFICNECEFMTTNLRNLTLHKARLHDMRKFDCPLCSSSFGLQKDLNWHLHTHTEKFYCDQCGKILKSKQALTLHVSSVHDKQKRKQSKTYLCTLCGRFLRSKTEYTVHRNREHLNVRPYVCNICNASFHASANLRMHRTKHMPARDFMCPQCGKTFKYRASLRAHLVIHEPREARPYQCVVCNKKFTQQTSLLRHVRIHTSERPYACSMCPATFNDSSILRRHLVGLHKLEDADVIRQAIKDACTEARTMLLGLKPPTDQQITNEEIPDETEQKKRSTRTKRVKLPVKLTKSAESCAGGVEPVLQPLAVMKPEEAGCFVTNELLAAPDHGVYLDSSGGMAITYHTLTAAAHSGL